MNHEKSVKYFRAITQTVSTAATCKKASVGCVLLDGQNNILATGYNGTPRGQLHCGEGEACKGACDSAGAGQGLCEAVHAEQNALLRCSNVDDVMVAFISFSPCLTCAKMLLNTNCHSIYYEQESTKRAGLDLWIRSGRQAFQIDLHT